MRSKREEGRRKKPQNLIQRCASRQAVGQSLASSTGTIRLRARDAFTGLIYHSTIAQGCRSSRESKCLLYTFTRFRDPLRFRKKKMTARDDIELVERETSALNRKLLISLAEQEHSDRMAKNILLRDSLLEGPGQAIAFYKVTDYLTRRMATSDAVKVWKKTRRNFLQMKRQWGSVEKFGDSEIDGIVAHNCKVYGDLAAKALREYRSYVETAYLLDSPANKNRLAGALYESATGRTREMTLEELAIPPSAR